MKEIKVDRYWAPRSLLIAVVKGYLKKGTDGLIFDFSSLPENYEVVIRSIRNKRRGRVIYQNLKDRN